MLTAHATSRLPPAAVIGQSDPSQTFFDAAACVLQTETVPYLIDNPEVGYVQTRWVFANPDESYLTKVSLSTCPAVLVQAAQQAICTYKLGLHWALPNFNCCSC